MTRFLPALGVANAVLYEGYILYPYTASAGKNRIRWQFGVVVPAEYAQLGTGEAAEQQTEVLFEREGEAQIDVLLRFLQVEARRVEAAVGGDFQPVDSLDCGGTRYVTFDAAIKREICASVTLLGDARVVVPIAFDGGREIETLTGPDGGVLGRIVRERWPLRGTLAISARALEVAASVIRLQLRVENESEVVPGPRSEALRTAFVSTHTILAAEGGRFLSALDPPAALAEATQALGNRNTWPVLVGDAAIDPQRSTLMLSSPIILYDFPAVAPQTDTDAFDATEIDELLTLSVLSLSDAERAEARATDPRARALVERAERYGPQEFARLHSGALTKQHEPLSVAIDPFAAMDLPSIDCVFIDGVKVAKGSSVRLRPKRRADVWDTFLAGKIATVRAIHQDFENLMYVAITVDDDPASDLHEWYGRSFFFYPDEIETVAAAQ